MMARETYMNASTALAFGIVDRIAASPVKSRVIASASSLPHRVYTALFGAGSGGNEPANKKETPMADSTPVAATLPEIQAAFPKASSDFIIKCLSRSLPLASVAAAAADELLTENEEMKAKMVAMEEELVALRAKAAEGDVPVEDDKEKEAAALAAANALATARRTGVTPVAKAASGSPSASARWNSAFEACLAKCNGNKAKAASLANRTNPGLREAYLAEANAR